MEDASDVSRRYICKTRVRIGEEFFRIAETAHAIRAGDNQAGTGDEIADGLAALPGLFTLAIADTAGINRRGTYATSNCVFKNSGHSAAGNDDDCMFDRFWKLTQAAVSLLPVNLSLTGFTR